MADSILAAAIKAAVEVQGVTWSGRIRVATPEQLAEGLSNALQHADGMTSREAVAAMIGESAQETDWYCSLVEYGGSNAWYAPYYGRGCIQLTHQSNYSAFGAWAQRLGYATSSADMVANPGKVAKMPWAWLACIWFFAANIPASYWKNRNWNAISGLINAGDSSYYVPAYELRTRSIIAALNILERHNWIYTGEDNMPTAQEIAEAVWGYSVKRAGLPGNDPRAGKSVRVRDIMAYHDAFVTEIKTTVPASVWNYSVTRGGLPDDDPRKGKLVTTGMILSYMDAFVLDVKNTIIEAVSSIATEADPEQILHAVDNAINKSLDQYIQLQEKKSESVETAPLDSNTHIVSAGETLKTISAEHGMTIAEITAANPDLEPNALVVGQEITIPTTTITQEG